MQILDEHCLLETQKSHEDEDSAFDFLYLPMDFRYIHYTSPYISFHQFVAPLFIFLFIYTVDLILVICGE